MLYDDCPLEHLSEQQLVDPDLRKTARYSVSGPLVLGTATIAGAAAPHQPGARSASATSSASASRSRTTLDALVEDPEYGDYPDLDGGKRTYVLWAAYQTSEASLAVEPSTTP